jgi:hypothetical protein
MADIIITPGSGSLVFYSGVDGVGELGKFQTSGSGVSYISTSGELVVDDLSISSTLKVPGLPENADIAGTDKVLVEQSGQVIKTDVSNLISDAGSITGVAPNEAVYISGGLLGTIYNTTIGDSVESVEVGGAEAGIQASEWKTKSVVEVLDTILFPTINASISSDRSVTLGVSGGGGTLEVGSTTSRSLTATFSQGSITNGDGTSGPSLVGAATQYTFTGTGISSTSQAGNVLSLGTPAIVFGSNNWAVTVDYAAGTGNYYDNKGNVGTNLDGSRVSGSVSDTTSSPTINGIYPYFWGLADSQLSSAQIIAEIEAGNANKVVVSASGTISIQWNASSKYLWFAHDSTYTTKTVWYVTALNNGSIGGGTNLFGSAVTGDVDSPDTLWSARNFKTYITNYATSTASDTMELRNS